MAAPVQRDQELELTIDSLAYGGNGVARLGGFVVFVRRGLPGDTVRARVTKVQRRHAEALATEVVTPGPQRVEAPDAVPAEGERVDRELELLIALNGGGHARRLAIVRRRNATTSAERAMPQPDTRGLTPVFAWTQAFALAFFGHCPICGAQPCRTTCPVETWRGLTPVFGSAPRTRLEGSTRAR